MTDPGTRMEPEAPEETPAPLETAKQFVAAAAEDAAAVRDTAVAAVEPLIERGRDWYRGNERVAQLLAVGLVVGAVAAIVMAVRRND
jgi:hypothetical protein